MVSPSFVCVCVYPCHVYVTVSVYWVGVGMYSCMWKPMVKVICFFSLSLEIEFVSFDELRAH